jgi:hypothetical protein
MPRAAVLGAGAGVPCGHGQRVDDGAAQALQLLDSASNGTVPDALKPLGLTEN